MKIVMPLALIALIHICAVVFAEDATSPQESEKDDRNLETVALPIAMYTSDTGFGGGFAAMKTYHPERVRISSLQGMGIVTEEKQVTVGVKIDHYLTRKRDRIDFSVQYLKFPMDYFGLGNDTDNDDPVSYTPEVFAFEGFYERVVYGNFSVKTLFMLQNQATVEGRDVFAAGIPYAGGRLDAGTGIGLVWDNRDNTNATQHGTFAQLEFAGLFLQDEGGSYNRITLDFRHFAQPFSGVVFASQGLFNDVRGDVPFYLLPSLGGQDELRGYESSRFIGRSMLALQQDVRFHIIGPFGGNVFVSTGQVADHADELLDGDLHTAWGAGLRFFFNKEEHMGIRLDCAFGEDSSGMYITFGEAF